MNGKFSMKMLVVLLAISLMPAYVFADEVGKITYVEGRVDIFKQNDSKAQSAREYDALSVGDSIRTKSNSKAEIKFKDNSIARLAQNSKITIQDYQFNEKGQRISAAIALERGKVRTIIAKMPHPADFDIITPNAKGVVKGSDIFTYYQAGASGMLVAEGALSVVNMAHPETPLLIPSGNSVLIPLEKLPEGPRPYLDLEAKLHEEDTNIPFSAVKAQKISTITAQISKFQGEVKVINKGQASAHSAKLNEVLMEGDEVQTGASSLAEIRLDNSNALNLKPNTKLLIVKLVFNPQTREYENIFEVTIGKVKARVEGIKGKSKFEIKTPLAICGVRGTILYVNVSTDGTVTLVEGGNGYITSLISGITQNVGSGESSSANGQGGVSNPTPTTQEERDSFTEGWDTGNGTEGYSASEGAAGEYLYGNDTDTGTGMHMYTGIDTTSGESVDIPFSESNPLTSELTFNFGYFDVTNNNIDFNASESFWAGRESVLVAATGHFTNPNNYNMWRGDLETTVGDAKVLGVIGGLRRNDNSLKGISYAFYIRPNGDGYSTGYLKSTNLGGNFANDLYNAHGDVSVGELAPGIFEYTTNVSPYDLRDGVGLEYGNMSIGLISGNGFLGALGVETANIIDQDNWGLWRATLLGVYDSLPTASWHAKIGGVSLDDNNINVDSYWIGDLTGDNPWQNGEFTGSVNVDILSKRHIGTSRGDIIGIYGNEIWEALGAGVNIQEPLQFVSPISDSNVSLSGLLGSAQSAWGATPASFTFMGQCPVNDGKYHLWGTDLRSYNYNTNPVTYTTYDGGAYYGMLGGTFKDIMEGRLIAIYIKDGNAGILSGNFNGTMYSDIDMFKATGILQATQKASDIAMPEDLKASLVEFNLAGSGSSIDNTIVGSITQKNSTMFNLPDKTWGIWGGTITGTYTASAINSPNWRLGLGGRTYTAIYNGRGDVATDSWLGTLSVSEVANGKLTGDFNGLLFSNFGDGYLKVATFKGVDNTGNTVGTYTEVGESGTWEAGAIGEWVEVAQLNPGFSLDELQQFVSNPVIEKYSNILNSTDSTGIGIVSAAMDMRLYANSQAALDGFWTAIINGKYSLDPIEGVWSAKFDTVTLDGTQWDSNQWAANVSGTIGGNAIKSGQAAGTYTTRDEATGIGTFTGIGAGKFAKGE